MMLRVALTGGIATGKSFCLARFAALGVPVIDADALAREAVAPGSAALAAIRLRFGDGVMSAGWSPRPRRARPDRLPRSRRARRARSDRPPRRLPPHQRVVHHASAGHAPRHRRHPAAVRDRPRPRLRPHHRVRLRAGRTDSPIDRARSPVRAGRARTAGGSVADRGEGRASRLRDPNRRNHGRHRGGGQDSLREAQS